MVLPSPAAPNAVPSRRWLDRLSAIFHLAREQGVVVLVRGGPERFGDVVRRVVELAPDAEVLVRADAMASLEPHSAVVLYLRRQDFEWLNMARPVVRGHRVVLFGDPETALALEQSAFDFFDWISHRIEAPAGPPAFAVRALRTAACARANVVVWKGGDLDATFAEALPGRTLVRVSAAQPYAGLVEAMRPRVREWVAVTDLGEGFRVQRARWAAAEAGRYGRTIWVEPALMNLEGALCAHSRPANVEEAAARLTAKGLLHGARVAALLDLEPEAIDRAEKMASASANKANIVATMTEMPEPAPSLDRMTRRLGDWGDRIDHAIALGDTEVAERWSRSWQNATDQGPAATATLARVVAFANLMEAQALLHQAQQKIKKGASSEDRFEVLRAEGWIRFTEGQWEAALGAFKKALVLARSLKKPLQTHEAIILSRALALVRLHRVDDAARMLSGWASNPLRGGAPFPANFTELRALAEVLLAQGKPEQASHFLEQARQLAPIIDDLTADSFASLLATARIAEGRHGDAESLLRSLIDRSQPKGWRLARLRRDLARVLRQLGRYAEAETELRRALDSASVRETPSIQLDLASNLLAQGRTDEANACLDIVLAADPSPNVVAMTLPIKARIEELRGNFEPGLEHRRRALDMLKANGIEPQFVLKSTMDLGRALLVLNRPSEAEPLLRRAVADSKRLEDASLFAAALTSLAEAQAAQGFAHASDTARRAMEAWSRVPSEQTLATRRALESIAAGGRAAPSVTGPRPRRVP